MSNRTDRRRKNRDNLPVAEGLTRKDLRDAEDELDKLVTTNQVNDETTFASLLETWLALDHQQESARLSYARVAELRKLGRTIETDQLIKNFAETKQELEILNKQLIGFLSNQVEDSERIKSLVINRHLIPGSGIIVRAPRALRDLLSQALEIIFDLTDEEGEKLA